MPQRSRPRSSELIEHRSREPRFAILGGVVHKTRRDHVEPINDVVPSVVDQAHALGGRLYWINSQALLPDEHHYNASVDPTGRFLVYRSETNFISTVGVCELEDGRVVEGTNRLVPLPRFGTPPTDRFEDPRVFVHDGQRWISYVHVLDGTVSIQLVRVDAAWRVVEHVVPRYAGNAGGGTIQKNWSFFSHGGELLFVYLADPHEVVRLRDETSVGRTLGVRWGYGIIRGGTPPVRVGDRYVTFFHSRRRDGNRFRYYIGAYAFAARPPFEPLAVTPEPLLAASGQDPQLRRLPLVVFPCGAYRRSGVWTVSLGVNDVAIALFSVEDDIVEQAMRDVSPRQRVIPKLVDLPEWLG